ncbi:MAG: DUF2007 domain-containing protein [bacterium]|nr:DUF2007 domain-containing protein [Myxococcales bacterium]
MDPDVVIFSSLNVAEVHLVRSMLTREGIGSRLRRQLLGPLAGEIPMDDARAELLVPAGRVAEATALIEAARAAADVERPCRACGEPNPGSFELCWQCGAELGPGGGGR